MGAQFRSKPLSKGALVVLRSAAKHSTGLDSYRTSNMIQQRIARFLTRLEMLTFHPHRERPQDSYWLITETGLKALKALA